MSKEAIEFHNALGASAVIESRFIYICYRIALFFSQFSFVRSTFQFLVLFLWSAILYLFLYWSLIPSTVHFSSNLYFNFDLDRPATQVFFATFDRQYEVITHQQQQRHGGMIHPFDSEEPYDISIEFILPHCPHSNTGVFMVEATLLFSHPKSNTTTVRSLRPCAIPLQTFVSRLFSDVLLAPFRFLFSSIFLPQDVVRVVLFEKYTLTPHTFPAFAGMNVTLGTNRVTVSESRLLVDASLSGLRYCVVHWFWISAIGLIPCLVCLQWACFHLAYYIWSDSTVGEASRIWKEDKSSEVETTSDDVDDEDNDNSLENDTSLD